VFVGEAEGQVQCGDRHYKKVALELRRKEPQSQLPDQAILTTAPARHASSQIHCWTIQKCSLSLQMVCPRRCDLDVALLT
jgi:hypothetical protein